MASDDLLSELRPGNLTELEIDGKDDSSSPKWSALVEAAKTCSLTRISVTGMKLGGSGEVALVQLLRNHQSTLCHVALEGLSLSVSTSRVLAEALPWATTMESLSLAHNGTLGPRGIKMWCEYLKQARQLFRLDCQACGMGHFGAQAVGQVLPRTLQSLNLSHNKLGADGMWKMASRLAYLSDLQWLDLSHNQLGDDGCLELARNLSAQNAAIETLRLAGNTMGDTGVIELIKILPHLEHLQTLDLSHNQLGDPSAKQLGTMLRKCPSLEVLDLSHNKIADQGCAVLVEGLLPLDTEEDCESGEEDSDSEPDDTDEADQNMIELSGLAVVDDYGADNEHTESRLRELRLEHNTIGDEGAGALVEHLDQIVVLQIVSLQGNVISDARLRILDMLLKHRTAITTPRKSITTETTITPEPSERADEGIAVSASPRKESVAHGQGATFDREAIEQGRELFLSTASSDDEDNMPELPMGYVAHMTDNWNRTTCAYGTYGPLLRAIDKEVEKEDEFNLCLVRKLELSSAGRMEAVRKAVLAELPSLKHQSIAPLSATSVDNGTYAFVYDIPDPSAITLRTCVSNVGHRKAMTWPVRLFIAWSIADALDFLHSSSSGRKAALHGALSPDSIYISSDFNHVYLLDAGMSRLLATDRSKFATGDVVYGTRAYRCPRYERGTIAYNATCDIFSLGVLLSEITTSRLQRSKEKKDGSAYDVYYDTVFARKPLKTDPMAGAPSKPLMQTLGQLTFACLSPIPEQRPTSSTVAQILKELLEQETGRK